MGTPGLERRGDGGGSDTVHSDERPVYGGGFFWVNGGGADPVPHSAYSMRGAGGQTTMIIPTHDLVVVRLGHFKGEAPGARALNRALALLVQAVRSNPKN